MTPRSRWRWPRLRRSLALRSALIFAGLVVAVWMGLIGWTVYEMLKAGDEETRDDLRDYANQVLAVVKAWPGSDEALFKVLTEVQDIERHGIEVEAARWDTPVKDLGEFRIRVWRGGVQLGAAGDSGRKPPQRVGELVETKNNGRTIWSWAAHAADTEATVELSVEKPGSAAIIGPMAFVAFLPLAVSLPLLLIPAWFLIRISLRPLAYTTREIIARVDSGSLLPLPSTPYAELDPLVDAMNKLTSRLSDQLAREREFVADVAHELKTPLAAIGLNIETAADTRDVHRRAQALAELRPALARMHHLLTQLLNLARLSAAENPDGNRQIDLAEFARQRVAVYYARAKASNITLVVDIPDTFPVILDPDVVAPIIDNLVDNAIKYSCAGGDVLFRLAHDAQIGVLEVTDQGKGIPPAEREHVTERFYRRTESVLGNTEGVGLGMAIVKRAAQRLGGELSLESGPLDRGLRVRVTFRSNA